MPKKYKTLPELWAVALAQLEVKVDNPRHFKTWIATSNLIELGKSKAIVAVKSIYQADWLKKRHQAEIESTLSHLEERKIKVEYKISQTLAEKYKHKVSSTNKSNSSKQAKQSKKATQPRGESKFAGYESFTGSPLLELEDGVSKDVKVAVQRSGLNPDYTFENFVVGESNKIANAAAQSVAEKPGTVYNPFFIYGHTGLGKTHIAHAIGRRLLEKSISSKIIYVPAEGFLNEMVNAIKKGKNKKFRDKYRREADLLIIDDIQYISNWEQTQTEFFNTFNALQADKKQIIIISDRAPDELEKLTPRLKSRFQGGIVVEVSRPDYEHRLAILEKKINKTGVDIDEKILDFIARNVSNNIRELEGALQKIILIKNVAPDTDISLEDVAKQIGKDAQSKRQKVNHKKVLKAVADEFDIKVGDIKGRRRTADIALARQVCMFILREELKYKYTDIANILNRKDHTTIMHGVDKIKSQRLVDEPFREQVVNITEGLWGI
jgi:chromosomal replication initiator protein